MHPSLGPCFDGSYTGAHIALRADAQRTVQFLEALPGEIASGSVLARLQRCGRAAPGKSTGLVDPIPRRRFSSIARSHGIPCLIRFEQFRRKIRIP